MYTNAHTQLLLILPLFIVLLLTELVLYKRTCGNNWGSIFTAWRVAPCGSRGCK